MQAVKRAIETHPLVYRFAQLTPQASAYVDALSAIVENDHLVPKRKDLLVEGYPATVIYLVKRGFGICYKLLPTGKRQILNVVLAGDIVGLPAGMFDHAPYSMTSLTAMTVSIVKLDRFIAHCNANPALLLGVMALLWKRKYVCVADHLINVGRRTPLERLAQFILEMHARLRIVRRAAGDRFEFPLSQEVIGDILSLSAPHVSRMFHKLKQLNLIEMHDHMLTIKDIGELKSLARFERELDRGLQLNRAFDRKDHGRATCQSGSRDDEREAFGPAPRFVNEPWA